MTQTSPKPAESKTTIALPSPTPRAKPSQFSFWQRVTRSWENLSFRYKLTVLLVTGTALPILILTQISVKISQKQSKEALQRTLHTDLLIQEDYFKHLQAVSRKEAAGMAAQIKEAAIDLNDPKTIEKRGSALNQLLSHSGGEDSFVILTDSQGKTIAQKIQILNQDFLAPPPMPTEATSTEPNYRPVAVSLGLNLGDVPIVKNTLALQRPLEGAELLKGEVLARLGLAPQAYIKPRSQPIKELPELEQPVPEGTYDIDQGKIGLVVMAVHPVKVNNRLVGAAIVGTLLNHNYTIVDQLKQRYGIPVVTFFAQDFRVSTNVPYFDPKTKAFDRTRSIGVRAAREATNPVLNQGQEYIGPSNIGGVEYIGAYRPLYDHQKELNPTQAKPVGMLGLSLMQVEAQNKINAQRWICYGVGGSILLLAGLAAITVAGSFSRPVRRLARFAQQIGAGEQGIRLEATERQDEIGVLFRDLNQMASSIESANLEGRRQEAERARLLADIASSRTRDFQDLESVFNLALIAARETLNVDRVVIYRFNADWSGYIATESVAPGWPRALPEKINDPCIGEHLLEAYRQGRVFPTNNVFEAGFAPEHMKLLQRLEIKANLVTPILQNDQLFGLLIAHHCDRPHAWQQSEINFLTQLAAQLGLIVDRVNFLEQQRTAKEKLQRRALELLMEVDPVSSGDLTIRASVTSDEIGTIADSYNATIGSLRKLVTQVQTAAKLVATTTSSSEVSVQELSAEALRQAQEITAALDRIQEMSNSIRAVATSASQAEAAVQQATLRVQAGDAAMNRTVDGIMAIRSTVAETSKKVKRLGESSQKISKVVNLIGTFADKTNLLALNAAIEAANAGEQGRGFAVVAEQVRSLARQSAQATAEVESLVKDIQTETNSVVAAMEAGTEQVVTGTRLVDETRQSLNQITAVSVQISALVSAISSAAMAQSQVSYEVTQTMSGVVAIAQHTSTEATLVSASFKELLAVATELQMSAGQFKVS